MQNQKKQLNEPINKLYKTMKNLKRTHKKAIQNIQNRLKQH